MRILLLALAACTATPAMAQVHLTPGATLDGGPTRTLDLAGIGTDCGNLAADLSAKTLTCAGNSSTNRLTNVDNVMGPLAPVPFQAFGNGAANRLIDRNAMSVLVGNGGDDTLSCKAVSSCWGNAGTDTFIYDGPDRVYYHKVKGKKVAYPVVQRAKDWTVGEVIDRR